MDLLYSTDMTIPVWQASILLVIITLALLYGRTKLALMVNYVFTLHCGYVLNRVQIMENVNIENFPTFTLVSASSSLCSP